MSSIVAFKSLPTGSVLFASALSPTSSRIDASNDLSPTDMGFAFTKDEPLIAINWLNKGSLECRWKDPDAGTLISR
jgi:hypothetical protein